MKLYKVEVNQRDKEDNKKTIVVYNLKSKNAVFEFMDKAQVIGSVQVGEPWEVQKADEDNGLRRETIIRRALRKMNESRTVSAYFFNPEYTFWVQEVKEDNPRSGILWAPKED